MTGGNAIYAGPGDRGLDLDPQDNRMRTFEADRRHLDRATKREVHVWVRMQHLRENGSADLVPLSQVLQKSAHPICRKKPEGAEKN
jgi:hypothetical protein